MSKPHLSEIETAFCTLMTNRTIRQAFLEGDKDKGACCVSEDVFSTLDKDGMAIYAGLITYGQLEVMESIYPACMKLIGDKWEDVVMNYIEKFPSSNHNLNQIARHFSEYLSKYESKWTEKYPFISELADYEWVELEVLEDPSQVAAIKWSMPANPEEFESLGPVVNPALRLKHFHYPIPEIVDLLESDESLDDVQSQDCFVAVYRHPETNACKFLELGQVAWSAVAQALKQRQSFRSLCELVVSQSGGADPQTIVLEFLELVERLAELKLLVGTEKL